MTLVGFKPEVTARVFLNEDLEFLFSHEIDPATVTQDTFRVVDEEGGVASGRWEASGRTLVFYPAPILQADYSGGGYRPGTRYRAELIGFPSLSGIASVEGWPLDRSRALHFETVGLDDESGALFDDASPGGAASVVIQTDMSRPNTGPLLLEPDDAIYLTCDEPLDPATLRAEDYWIRSVSSSDIVPLNARFLTNHDEGEVPGGEPAAVIELVATRHLPPGPYMLRSTADVAIRDLGGNALWRPERLPIAEQLEVVAYSEVGAGAERDELSIEFVKEDSHLLTLLRAPEADGTLSWRGGRASIRYPRAAGDGSNGNQVLTSGWPGEGWSAESLDLNSVKLWVPSTESVSIEQSGLVILRAQGQCLIEGALRRSTPAPGSPEVTQDLNIVGADGPIHLSEWLEEVREDGRHWTVLVVGGDLIVGAGAEIDVDTPLLIVVGGRIRVSSRASITAPRKRRLLTGGGVSRDPDEALYYLGQTGRPTGTFELANRLEIDEPLSNPLREPLRVSVLTSPLPKRLERVRWRSFRSVAHQGTAIGDSGGAFVRFLPVDEPPSREAAVDDPRELDGTGRVRIWIELELPASSPGNEAWDPPWVDAIHLGWQPF